MNRYTVVLLDDEELILESLQTLVDWDSLRCHIIGTAHNGAAGRLLLERLHPDLVVTDIKMPGFSGLQLAEYCAAALPDTKVIILSAYADFSYAQSALRAGAINYLLKPISQNELYLAVQHAVSELDQQQSVRLSHAQEKADLENAQTLASSSLLFNLARYGTPGIRRADHDWLQKKVSVASEVIAGKFYNTVYSTAPSLAMGQEYTDHALQHAGYTPVFGSADDKLVLLCPLTTGIDLTTARNRLIMLLKELLRTLPAELGVGVFCISGVYCDEKQLQQCYRTAKEMIHHAFFRSCSGVISGSPESSAAGKALNTQELLFALRNGQAERVGVLLADWKLTLVRIGDEQLALSKLRELTREATLCADRVNMDTAELWHHRYENENFDARCDCLHRGLLEICNYMCRNSSIVGRMCLYVEKHYGDCSLNLETLSNEFGLNNSYLSRIFKKEQDENFSEYLVRIRIEHAKALLSGTQLRTRTIAEQVGFADAHYFSQVFKRKCGVSPAEYRAANNHSSL